MINIIKNISRILFKRKSFILTSFIMPICLIFLFSFLYSGNSSFNVAVINNDDGKLGNVIENRLENINGVSVKEVSDNNYDKKLVFHEIELVIEIDKNFTKDIISGNKNKIKIKSIANSDMEPTIMSVLENETKSLSNLCSNIDVNKVGIDNLIKTFENNKPSNSVVNTDGINSSINDGIGIILYLIFVCAGITCGFLLEDEREGTKDRVLMGNVNERQYYCGVGLVFFALTSIPAVEYYVVCRVLKYEFGFENKIILLLLLIIVVLMAVSFNILLSSIIKKKNVLTLVNGGLLVPVFMLSGAFWPFDIMSERLQKIGNAIPIRWIYIAMENLSQGQSFSSIVPIILGLIVIVIFLFALSIFFTRNKMILVKEDK